MFVLYKFIVAPYQQSTMSTTHLITERSLFESLLIIIGLVLLIAAMVGCFFTKLLYDINNSDRSKTEHQNRKRD